MELIKQTIKLGNSSAVILPRAWIKQKVKVQLIKETITDKILEILKERDILKEARGIYITGSYARDEQTTDSDIDILVITNSLNKQMSINNYEITLISKSSLDSKIKTNLYLLATIKEAKTILNDSLLQYYKALSPEIPIKKHLEEIKKITKINSSSIELSKENKEKVADGIIYSIILRLRELYLIDSIINNKKYSNQALLAKIQEINPELYNAYLRIKRAKPAKNNSKPEDALALIKLTKKLIENAKQKKKT